LHPGAATAQIAVMGPEAAINAVYYNKIQDTPEADREAFVQRLQDDYRDTSTFSVSHPS